MAKEMGLDRAPIEFWKLVFLDPPTAEYEDFDDAEEESEEEE